MIAIKLFLIPVVPDVLDVVVIFHGIDELFHLLDLVFAIQPLVVLGNHLDLSGDESILAQVGNNIVELIGKGVDGFDC